MDCLVARAADDQGLTASSDHDLDPLRLGTLSVGLEVFQCLHVMHLDAILRAAKLAGVGKEALEKVCSDVPDPIWLVVKDCIYSPLE